VTGDANIVVLDLNDPAPELLTFGQLDYLVNHLLTLVVLGMAFASIDYLCRALGITNYLCQALGVPKSKVARL